MTWRFRRPPKRACRIGRAIGLGRGRAIGKNKRTTRFFLILIAGWLAAGGAARADEQMVQEFDGHNSLTTSDFQAPNGWEIRWHSEQVLSIGVIRLDNTVVAGATGRDVGSLFVSEGGHYRLRVRGQDPIPWDVKIYALPPAAPPPADGTGEITFYEPTPGPDYKPPPKVPVPVVKPETAPVAAAPPPLPTELSADQRRAIVMVKGDRAQGAGFFLKTGIGTVVITTLGLLSNNPNLQIETATGARVTIAQIQGATDRDLAMISVKDFGYPGLEPGSLAAVQSGDTVLTTGANATAYSPEPVVAVGEKRVEVRRLSTLIGAPVVHAKSGKAIGVVNVEAPPLSIANFNDENFSDREADRADATAAFALRFDNVPGWETYVWDRLQNQTMFLDNFHQHTRELDSYLNGDDEEGSKLWQSDEKIKSANSSFLQDTAGGDPAQRIDALHALLFELGLVADTDMDQIALPANFYSYENKRARVEMAYRQALKAQLDTYRGNVSRFNGVASRNN